VAHNAKMPFHVSIASPLGDGRGMEVEVLGTHFNINAYTDELSIKTTLLEGSVKVSRNDESKMLKPNEQMLVAPNSPLTIDHSPNIDEVIAWKNGLFRFESQDLETVMRQLSRWYDVEVNYKVKTNRHFTGIISRNVNASEVLKMLEMAGGMHFNIDGKKIIVEK